MPKLNKPKKITLKINTKQIKSKSKPSNKKKKNNPRPSGLGLSKCAAHYAIAVGNPFSPSARGACIPTFPARLSQKSSARATGTFAIGSAGFGYVVIQPCVAQNIRCINATTNAYALTNIDINVAGQTTTALTTQPYGNGAYLDGTNVNGSSVSSRIVSVGLRVRYTGKEVDKGGTMYMLTTPDHTSIQGFSVADLAAFSECIRVPVSRQWQTLVASSIDMDECVYPEETGVFAGNGNQAQVHMCYPYSQDTAQSIGAGESFGAPIMGIAITSSATNTFEYELVIHMETVGSRTSAFATKSHSDQQGLSQVTDAAGKTQANRAATGAPQERSFMQAMSETIYENRETIVPLVEMAASMYSNSLRGRPSIMNGRR